VPASIGCLRCCGLVTGAGGMGGGVVVYAEYHKRAEYGTDIHRMFASLIPWLVRCTRREVRSTSQQGAAVTPDRWTGRCGVPGQVGTALHYNVHRHAIALSRGSVVLIVQGHVYWNQAFVTLVHQDPNGGLGRHEGHDAVPR
jgi:hypothetical protein